MSAPEPGTLVGTVVGGHYKVRRLISGQEVWEVYAADRKGGEMVASRSSTIAPRRSGSRGAFTSEASIAG